MANPYYTFSPSFVPGTKVRSDQVNTQYQGLETAFDLLPSSTTALTTGTATFAGTSGGSGNAYTATPPDARIIDNDGDEIVFIADRANTGAVTLNVDGNGAQALVRADGSALEANDLQLDLTYVARYDITNTRWQLIGPSASYLTNASASAAASAASAAAASTSETNAATSETNAAVSEAAALASQIIAGQWAVHPEDDDLDSAPGEFSALHWAAKSAASATGGLLTGTGVVAPSAGTPYDYDATLTFENANSISTATLGWDGASSLQLESLAFGAAINIIGRNAAGSAVNALTFAPSGVMALNQGAVSINANGIIRLTSDVLGAASIELDVTTSGLILRDTVTASPNNLFIRFIEDSGFPVTLANFGYVASDIFTVDGLATQVNINTNSPSGVLISHIGVNVFQTFVGGFKTLGTRFEVDNDGADTLASVRVRNLTGGVDLRVVPGGNASISQLVGTTGGFEDDWINFTRNGAVGLNFNNALAIETTTSGGRVQHPTAGTPILELTNSSAVALSRFRNNSSSTVITGLVHGGALVLEAEDTLGALQTLAIFSPDGAATLNFAGTSTLSTTALGADISGTILELDSGADSTTLFRALNTIGGISVQVEATSGEGRISQRTAAGAIEEAWITMARNGAVRLFNDGSSKLQTTADGVDVINSAVSNTILDVVGSGTNIDGVVGVRGDSGGARFYWDESALAAIIGQTAAGGTLEESWIEMVDNGAVTLFNNGLSKFLTTADGVDVVNSAVAPTLLDVIGSGLNIDGIVGFRGDSGGGIIKWDESIATARIRQTSAAGLEEESWIDMVDNGAVTVFHNGTAMARTALAASGGLEANNTVTGAGFERVLTVSDIPVIPVMVLLAANKTMTSTETLTDVTGFTATTLASTRYKFRIVLFVQSGTAGTNPGLRLLLNHTTAQSSKEGRILEFRDSGLVQSVRALPDASTITGLNAGTTSDENMLVYEGFFETITAGTLQLEAAQNTSNGTGTIITEGSSFEVWATQ